MQLKILVVTSQRSVCQQDEMMSVTTSVIKMLVLESWQVPICWLSNTPVGLLGPEFEVLITGLLQYGVTHTNMRNYFMCL